MACQYYLSCHQERDTPIQSAIKYLYRHCGSSKKALLLFVLNSALLILLERTVKCPMTRFKILLLQMNKSVVQSEYIWLYHFQDQKHACRMSSICSTKGQLGMNITVRVERDPIWCILLNRKAQYPPVLRKSITRQLCLAFL